MLQSRAFQRSTVVNRNNISFKRPASRFLSRSTKGFQSIGWTADTPLLKSKHKGSFKCLNETSIPYYHGVRIQTRQFAEQVGDVLAMPALSPTMEKGNIIAWRKKVGDHLNEGDILCEIETDKATLEFENPEEGYLAAILVDAGSVDVPLGKPIAVIVNEKSDIKKVKVDDFAFDKTAEDNGTQDSKPKPESISMTATLDTRQTSGVLSPAVRSLVETNNLDPSLIPATGPKSRLLKGDVLKVLKSADVAKYQRAVLQPKGASQKISPSDPEPKSKQPILENSEYEDVPLSQMRKVIAQRLLESKQTLPHAYQTVESRMDQALNFRQKLKDLGVKISVNDLIIKAAGLALRDVPECNVVNGVQSKSIDISVAVATDRGLITPIIKNVTSIGLNQIATQVKELAVKARENKLKPEEFQGGTFSISNLGMFGISEFKAVINPPQGLILAIGATQQRLTVANSRLANSFGSEEEYEEALDFIVPANAVPELGNFMSASVSLSNIHVDPADVSRFLAKFKGYMENPQAMVL